MLFIDRPPTFCVLSFNLKSHLRHRGLYEPEAQFIDENTNVCLCPLHRWWPSEPSDGTIHP